MRKADYSIGGSQFRIYSGMEDFDNFRATISSDRLEMLDLTGLSSLLVNAHASGDDSRISGLVSSNRVWLNTGLLWTPGKIYIWDNPEIGRDKKVSVCKSTSDLFLTGHSPDSKGISWYEEPCGRVRSLGYGFDSGHLPMSHFENHTLVTALARPKGVMNLSSFYPSEDSFLLSAHSSSETDESGTVSVLSFRGPYEHDLSINPDTNPQDTSTQSIAIARKGNILRLSPKPLTSRVRKSRELVHH